MQDKARVIFEQIDEPVEVTICEQIVGSYLKATRAAASVPLLDIQIYLSAVLGSTFSC